MLLTNLASAGRKLPALFLAASLGTILLPKAASCEPTTLGNADITGRYEFKEPGMVGDMVIRASAQKGIYDVIIGTVSIPRMHPCNFEGKGHMETGVLEIVPANGAYDTPPFIVSFQGKTAYLHRTWLGNNDWCGVAGFMDGKYVREKKGQK